MTNMYLKYTLTDDQLMESFDTLIEGMGIEDERMKIKLKSKLKTNSEKNIDIDFIEGVFYNKNNGAKIPIDELIKVVELENVLVLKFATRGNIIIPLNYIYENNNYKDIEVELKKIARENKKKIEARDYSQVEVLTCEGVSAKKQYVAHKMFNLRQSNQYMYIIFAIYTIGIILLATLAGLANIYNFANGNIAISNPYRTANWILILCLLICAIGIKFGFSKYFETKISDEKINSKFEFGKEQIKVSYANIEKTFRAKDVYGYEVKSGYLIIYIKRKKGFELVEIVLSKIDKNLKKEICARIEEVNDSVVFKAEIEKYIKEQKKKRKILFIVFIVVTMISFLISINILDIIYKIDRTYFEKLLVLRNLRALSNIRIF
ncbi:MAG: hypothetical protein ACRC41_14240 [Sarcina sp.]